MNLVEFLTYAPVRRYGASSWIVAAGLVGAAILVRIFLAEPLEGSAYVTFYPAVVAASLFFGWPQGVFVVLLSALAGAYLFLHPTLSFGIENIAAIGVFLIGGGFTVALIAAMSEAFRRADLAANTNETLFRELQHRVANNLQLVVNLIRLAQRDLDNTAAASATLNQAEQRIMKMSDLHQQIYGRTAFDQGLEPLLQEILTSTLQGLPVDIHVSVEDVSDLAVEKMTAVAFLVNEAALNALKHVFSKGLGARFEVKLSNQQNGRLRLTVADDGPGVEETSKGQKRYSLGMGIMEALATQLGGSLTVDAVGGARLYVDFPKD
ncbi:histidine kinase dimerization/phosphoacceptor domain -containing protein [Methylocystis echinoides]|uniref:histidine kinase dimerization/phosphoacceptor domain -containing protein n=1 Tax=Methylocystis echinoides TaxID=29468 RepID=UPI00343A2874